MVKSLVTSSFLSCLLGCASSTPDRAAGEPAAPDDASITPGTRDDAGGARDDAALDAAPEGASSRPDAATASGRLMERLGRGLVAVCRGNGNVYVSWRLLALDPPDTTFNLYRSTAGAAAVKLAGVTQTTDYADTGADTTKSNAYFVRPVVGGVEQAPSTAFTVPANARASDYFALPLRSIAGKAGAYATLHVYPGDLDGDGEYDYVVKRFPANAEDSVILDAYLHNGAFAWRVDLGPNIELGNNSATSPVLVADFDGDGKAEVMVKTGEGTTFGDGAKIGDANGDGVGDYRTTPNASGYQVLRDGCPEFLSILDGTTGAERARDDFIPRGPASTWSSYWGDSYGARMNFIMAITASFDGELPSMLLSRGPGDKMDIVAWDYRRGKLERRFAWTSRGKTFNGGRSWVDFHAVRALDLDGDGRDEVSWGLNALDDDGSPLYATASGLVHGDRFQIGDFDPARPGLEGFAIQQNNPALVGAVLFDAADGTVLQRQPMSAVGDVGRGDANDVDPTHIGVELYSYTNTTLWSPAGVAVAERIPAPGLGIWWDGDLSRELLQGIGSTGMSPAINKWNPATSKEDRLYTVYNAGGSYATVCTYAGRPPFVGDIMGDWREELVLEDADATELRIFTTWTPATTKLYTLMQNPAYRNGATTKGYLQTNYTDYYLGTGMAPPPTPRIRLSL